MLQVHWTRRISGDRGASIARAILRQPFTICRLFLLSYCNTASASLNSCYCCASHPEQRSEREKRASLLSFSILIIRVTAATAVERGTRDVRRVTRSQTQAEAARVPQRLLRCVRGSDRSRDQRARAAAAKTNNQTH